jgi:hypothetical protein
MTAPGVLALETVEDLRTALAQFNDIAGDLVDFNSPSNISPFTT